MGSLQSITNHSSNIEGLVHRDRPLTGDDLLQGLALHIFHDDIMLTVLLAHVKDVHNIGMG